MYLVRLLQINVATQVALGALLLGMGRREVGLALTVAVAAFASVWITDIAGWFRLNRVSAAIAAVVASFVALRELIRLGGDTQALAVASLLVYLQIILLFQQKDMRIYWQLIMLSLLEVVISAAFSQGAGFGPLLILYMLLGMSALALLTLYHQVELQQGKPSTDASPIAGRWTLDERKQTVVGSTAGSTTAAVGRELFGRLVRIALATLAITMLLFAIVPRVGTSGWREAIVEPRRTVGFSDTVALGELGSIIENPQEVMRLRLVDGSSGERYPVGGPIYLRGAVLTTYNDQQWRRENSTKDPPTFQPEVDFRHDDVVQEITVEPLDRPELFSIWPPLFIEGNDNVSVERGRLLRHEHLQRRRFAFRLGTLGLLDGRQRRVLSCGEMREGRPLVDVLLRRPDLPQLVALAEKWDVESGLDASDVRGRAKAIEMKLRNSGRFSYSLEGQPRDPSIDPIEDFIVNNPRGHCEYFATALAMMLRSRDIPSRLVVGYLCDEYNDLGEFYQVRQLHAHAWVEAYLPAEDAWLRLDATPGGAGGDSGPGQIERGLNWLEYAWQNYVVEMDAQRQAKAVYQPIVDAISDLFAKLKDPKWWRSVWQTVKSALSLNSISGLLWWIALIATLTGLGYFVLRAIGRIGPMILRLAGRLTGSSLEIADGRQAKVEFYSRLELILERHGLRRRPGQTHSEFAAAAGNSVAELTGQNELMPLPALVVNAFYRVRFGQISLDAEQAAAVEQALAKLDVNLRKD